MYTFYLLIQLILLIIQRIKTLQLILLLLYIHNTFMALDKIIITILSHIQGMKSIRFYFVLYCHNIILSEKYVVSILICKSNNLIMIVTLIKNNTYY